MILKNSVTLIKKINWTCKNWKKLNLKINDNNITFVPN